MSILGEITRNIYFATIFILTNAVNAQWIFSDSDFQKDMVVYLNSDSLNSYSAELESSISTLSTIAVSNDDMESFKEMQNSIIYLFPSNESTLLNIMTKIAEFLNGKWTYRLWKPIFVLTWLHDTNEEANIMKFLENTALNLSIDNDVYIIILDISGETLLTFSLVEMYKIKNMLFAVESKFTNPITTQDSLGTYRLLQKVLRRQNFNRAPIIAVEMLMDVPQLARYITVGPNGTTFIGGYDVYQFWYLRDSLNFTGIEMEASGWIGSNPDGSPKGMNAQVINDDADLAIAATYAYYDPKLIFLQPIQTADLYAFFVQPPGQSIRDIFFRPFKLRAWISIAALWTLAAIMIFIIVKLKKLKGNVSSSDQYMLDGAIFWVVSSITSKGWEQTPNSLSLKLVMLSGMMFSVLTMTLYSSILISYLSVEIVPIQNFGDMLKMGFTIYASGYTTVTNHSIKAFAKTTTLKRKISLMEKRADDAMPIVLKTMSAFVGISEELFGEMKNDSAFQIQANQISKVLVSTVKTRAGAFVKRSSNFKEFFNYKIISLFENGIRYRLMKGSDNIVSSSAENNALIEYNQREISLTDATIPFLMLSVGHILGIVVTFMERLW